jgi:hypothetical protein
MIHWLRLSKKTSKDYVDQHAPSPIFHRPFPLEGTTHRGKSIRLGTPFLRKFGDLVPFSVLVEVAD